MSKPQLSKNTFRGLYIDILEGVAKVGTYFFGDYVIKVSKKKEEDIGEKIVINIPQPKSKIKSTNSDGSSDRHKKLYWKRKNVKECTKCGAKDYRTLNGATLCISCSKKQKSPYRGEYNKEKYLSQYKRNKESGKCIKCGEKRAIGKKGKETLFCESCLIRKRKYDRNKYYK